MTAMTATLTALESAGRAVQEACLSLEQDFARCSQRIAAAVLQDPGGTAGDGLYAQCKEMALLSREITGLGEQLQRLHAKARQLQAMEPALVLELPKSAKKRVAIAATVPAVPGDAVLQEHPDVQDVSFKEVRSRRTAAPVRSRRASSAAPRPSNDVAVMAYLKTVLNRRGFRVLKHTAIAQGAGIPTGSVGASMARLRARGAVLSNEAGALRLA